MTDTQKTLQSSQVSEADRFISDMQDNDRNLLNQPNRRHTDANLETMEGIINHKSSNADLTLSYTVRRTVFTPKSRFSKVMAQHVEAAAEKERMSTNDPNEALSRNSHHLRMNTTPALQGAKSNTPGW